MRTLIGVLIIIFIFLLGFIFIFGRHGKKAPAPVAPVVLPLPEYANTSASVSLTIDGVINGDDTHRAFKITIGRDKRTLDIIQGYSGHVISSNTNYNTVDAYSVFLKAINLVGFDLSRKTATGDDPSGYCPDGFRYIYNLEQDGKTLSNLWNTNCSTKLGNFGGVSTTVIDLFQKQITNYDQLTADVEL